MLRLDGHEAVEGRSQGPMRQLDLEARPLYVGGMPHNGGRRQGALLDNLGLTDAAFGIGFSGCVRRFKLGYREVKVQSSLEPLSVRRRGIRECRAPSLPPSPPQPVVAHDHQASSPCDARYHCCCCIY